MAAGHPKTTAFVITDLDDFAKIVINVGKHYDKSEKAKELR